MPYGLEGPHATNAKGAKCDHLKVFGAYKIPTMVADSPWLVSAATPWCNTAHCARGVRRLVSQPLFDWRARSSNWLATLLSPA